MNQQSTDQDASYPRSEIFVDPLFYTMQLEGGRREKLIGIYLSYDQALTYGIYADRFENRQFVAMENDLPALMHKLLIITHSAEFVMFFAAPDLNETIQKYFVNRLPRAEKFLGMYPVAAPLSHEELGKRTMAFYQQAIHDTKSPLYLRQTHGSQE